MIKQAALANFKLGIDLGGTKTEVVVLDPESRPIFRKRMKTPAQDYAAILGLIAQLVTEAEQFVQFELPIGIGTPGAISPQSGLLRNSNTVCMNGRALRSDIEACLQRSVTIENDANCFALSEALTGAGRDYEVVFGVIIGTGTGGGLVVRQQLLKGLHRNAGEWGHNPLPWLTDLDSAPGCYCGKSACVETFVSGSGLARSFQLENAKALSCEEIVQAARDGEKSGLLAMERYYDQLARGLAQVINIIDPDVIILGGGLSNIGEIYQQVPARLGDYVFSDYNETPLLPAFHGDASGVFGAALLSDVDSGKSTD